MEEPTVSYRRGEAEVAGLAASRLLKRAPTWLTIW